MNQPYAPGPIPLLPMSLPRPRATAHLVAWIDTGTGRIVDAGLYSEESPTIALQGPVRTKCLLSSMSRTDSFERALYLLRREIARTPELHWVYGMRSFMRGERSRRQMEALRAHAA